MLKETLQRRDDARGMQAHGIDSSAAGQASKVLGGLGRRALATEVEGEDEKSTVFVFSAHYSFYLFLRFLPFLPFLPFLRF